MKQIVAVISLIILGLVSAPSFASTTHALSDDEKALIQMESAIAEAIVRRDIKFLDRVWSAGFVRTDPYSGEMNKEQSLIRLKSNADKIESVTINSLAVRVNGDTAIVTGRMMVQGRNPNTDLDQQYQHFDRFTHTFVKRQGAWQIVAAHASLIVAYGIHTDY